MVTSGRMIDFLGQGLFADRPVTLNLHADGIGFYWAIDTTELYFWGGSPPAWIGPAPTSVISDFLGLTDTPASYTGHALKLVVVNAGETALEFSTAPAIPTTEQIQDIVGALIVAGAGITVTYDDALATLTIACTITQYTNAMADARAVAAIAAASIDDLSDVDITTTPPNNGDTLIWDVNHFEPGAGGGGGPASSLYLSQVLGAP